MSKTILIAEMVLPVLSPPLNGCAVTVEDDSIIDIEPVQILEKKYPDAKRIDLKNAIIMPGLINIHTHLELSGLKGCFREGIDFIDWIKGLIEKKRVLKRAEYETGVANGIKELIGTGTTSVGEITSEDISPYMLDSYGIRGKVFYEVIGLSYFISKYIWFKKRAEINRFRGNGLTEAGISPHSCYSLTYGLLKRVGNYSIRHGLSLSSHISETKDESEFIRSGGGKIKELLNGLGFDTPLPFHSYSPTFYFNELGLLRKDFIAAHAVWVDEKDMDIMKESSISVAHCPRSNLFLNVGKSPVIKLLKTGINVGLGTDSLASNHSLNMWDEMRSAYKLHRDDGLSSHEIIKMATVNGAKALGLDDKVGTIEVGKKADLIAVKMPENLSGDIYSDLIRETKNILITMVSGKILYQEEKGWN
ncbi:MAG: amidohydrolase family protein [Nitrospirota bacterium]